MKQTSLPGPFRNRLLASLPAAVMDQLSRHLSRVLLPGGLVLREAGQTLKYLYFLEDGVCSIVADMEDGTTIEVSLIGREGFVGVPEMLGVGCSHLRTFMQIGGSGYRVKRETLTALAVTSAPLRACLMRSVYMLLAQTAQTAACNRVHELTERLARWLLMCHDRVESDKILITQEFLAGLLGSHRSSVAVAEGILQDAGLIAHTRGQVAIRNRAGLIDAACECYRSVHNEGVRLGLFDESLPDRTEVLAPTVS